MAYKRTDRVAELLRETLSELILREVRDPRIDFGRVSLTAVQVSPDLRRALVFVSHMGEAEERDLAVKGLQHAAHFLHREMVKRLDLRRVPELEFRSDPSIERGARLASMIQDVQEARQRLEE